MSQTEASSDRAPFERARRAAFREIAALARFSPAVQSPVVPSDNALLVAVDAPYLACGASPQAPLLRRGFSLGIHLPPQFPAAPPDVAFLAEHRIFHPGVSPTFGVFCLGRNVWHPDLGLARFVVLHIEAVLGLVEIDTLDGLVADPVCREAAYYYRALREAGRLPLAKPCFSMPVGRRVPQARRAAQATAEPPGPRRRGLLVPARCGARRVAIAPSDDGASFVVTATLCQADWTAALSAEGSAGLDWLSERLSHDAGGPRALSAVGGEVVFRARLGSELTADARRELGHRIETIESAVLALGERRIAVALAAAILSGPAIRPHPPSTGTL